MYVLFVSLPCYAACRYVVFFAAVVLGRFALWRYLCLLLRLWCADLLYVLFVSPLRYAALLILNALLYVSRIGRVSEGSSRPRSPERCRTEKEI